VNPFALQLPPRILFGAGTASELPRAVAEMGRRVLVITGSSPQRLAPVLGSLGPHEITTVSGEPTIDDARTAAQVGRSHRAEVVVGVGGGSVIDLAKATAMLLGNGGDPLDYLEVVGRGHPITASSVPMIAVPTTAGTGAEVTANAVLASPSDGVKASLRSPLMVPRLAIVDPELTLACPPAVTAASGMDAMTQCLEPYVSNKANPVTDAWARTGLIHAGAGLRAAYADGGDSSARTDMSLASLMGGLALANAKLGAVHGFAAVLGGMSSAPHGALCAALLVPVCRANLARADGPLRQRFDDVARWLTGHADASAEDGLQWLADTVAGLGIPGLAAFGFGADRAEEVVAKAARASSMQGNPVVLGQPELAAIYSEAL
jgi:alcohol dehydrogenase class IV